MTVHIIVLLTITILGFFIYLSKSNLTMRRKNKLFVIISELCFFAVISLRSSSVGLDTWRYEYYFYKICDNPEYYKRLGWEPLYVLINLFARRFHSFQLVLIICAFITVMGFGYFLLKNTEDKESAFWFIYFYITLNLYFNSMHLIRQICAMAICVNIYTVLKKEVSLKSAVKCIVLLVMGLGFHITAVFSIVYIIPFVVKNLNRKTVRNLIVVSLAGMVGVSVAQRVILRYIPRFSIYMNDDRLSTGRIGIFVLSMMALKIVMIALSLKLDPENPANKEMYRLTCIVVISTAFYILQTRTQFALRLGYYYEVFMLLYIPGFIRKLKTVRSRRVAYILMYAYGLIYFIYMLKFGGARSNRGTVPYLFYWQNN